MTSASPLECRQLTCGYPGRTVLHNINLTLEEGSVTALLGPNGSGKSTLLKTISKLVKPTEGEVYVGGEPVSALSYRELAKRVAFVPQEEQLAYEFTARQMVTMGRLPLSGGFFDTAEDREEAEQAMTTADCIHLADRPVTELSGGEKQRVLIARALAQKAKVLLMDEPTSHLDVGHQVAIAAVMRNLAGQGYVLLVAVHDLNLAAGMADDAVLLRDGRIALHGPVKAVLNDPVTDSVYGVAFRRLEPDAEGRIYLFPPG